VNVSDAFAKYQWYVDAGPAQVKEARERAASFKGAFNTLTDVDEVFMSGSLARKTHKDPIHDVDVVIIYNEVDHPGWGDAGDSAEDALNYTREKVNALLGATNGTYDQLVRLARWRNHAVKCFIDDPDDEDAFTVDAMPALRKDGYLLIPEFLSRKWVACDPEHLIDEVQKRREQWGNYPGTVRMLKDWASIQTGVNIKSLVMEVLALDNLPLGRTQSVAVKEFFVKAAHYIESGYGVEDPAGYCGPIQIDLDYDTLGDRLRVAADNAAHAVVKQSVGDDAGAIRSWRDVFGEGFPKPPSTGPAPAVVPPVLPRPVKDTPQG